MERSQRAQATLVVKTPPDFVEPTPIDYRDTPSRPRKTGDHNLKSKYAVGSESLNDKKTRG